jgi:beta-lactamase class A
LFTNLNFGRILIVCVLIFSGLKGIRGQSLPLDHEGKLRPVRELSCVELEKSLKDEIARHPTWNRLVESKRMAIGIADLRQVDKVHYAGLNDDHMMYAASLPKIAVLLAVNDAIQRGELTETHELQEDLKEMISRSNNRITTKYIDVLGYEKIERSLRDAYHKLYEEEMGGGLWVGKRYASTGERYPDPLTGLSHGATASQAVSFYYQLAFGHLINRERSAKMLETLKDPALKHKFVNTLMSVAPDAEIYRKSGSWKNFHSDSVLVWGPERRYILVALIEDPSGEQIIRDLVEPMESVLKTYRAANCN